MKKIILFVFCSIFTLLSGGLLCSCGSGRHTISFTLDPEFVSVSVLADGVEVRPSSPNKFVVGANAKIRVEFSAAQRGVDMSKLVVKANGKDRTVQKFNMHFDSLHSGGDLCYGYILFSGMKENVTISVSGAESYKNNFNFVGADLEDETSVARLKNASIKTPDSEDFVSFFDFLSQDEASFNVDIIGQDESGRSFQMKFDGGNPYEITTISPFKIQVEDENNELQTKELKATNYSNGIYTFQLGDIGNNVKVDILTDFKELKCRDFDLTLPQENLTFQTILVGGERETFNYESEAKVTVKKIMSDATMDKEVVKAYINDLELSKDTEAQDQADEMTFLIPKGITPESTKGDESYDLRVTGISYGEKETFSLKASTTESHPIKLIEPKFFSADEQGALSDVVGFDDDGNVITFENKKAALTWKYSTLDGNYITPFDIYDYNINRNGTKLLNLKEVLDEEKHKQGFVEGQDIVAEKDEFMLRAHFNSDTHHYDEFQIEFSADEDSEFVFADFVYLEKDVSISFDFEDERVGGVEYAIGNVMEEISGLTWETLTIRNEKSEKMIYGQAVFFRLKIEGQPNILGDGTEFVIAPTIANQGRRLDSELYRENGENFIILKFPLSDTFFDNVQNMKLVLGRDLTNA